MARRSIYLVTGLLALLLLFGVPAFVGAQSGTSQTSPVLSPRDWVPAAIQGTILLIAVLVGLRIVQKLYTQRERHSDRENLQKQFTEILDRLVAPEPSVRANAALRLAEFGKLAVPLERTGEKVHSYFGSATAQLATALHLETNPGIRASIRESLQILAHFAGSIGNDTFLKTLVMETADANRACRAAFITALAEYAATLPEAALEEDSTVKRLAAVTQFGDKPEATFSILKSLMTLHEFKRGREIYAAVRATLDPETLRREDVARMSRMETAAASLRESRDALAYALCCISPPENAPAELDSDSLRMDQNTGGSAGSPLPARLNLSGCFLAGAQLNRAYLRRVDLRDAFLQGAALAAADLQAAVFIKAQMQEACLTNAALQWANLDHGSLAQANLANAKLKGASLNEAQLVQADLNGVNFQDSSLVNANFAGASLIGTSFEGACLFRINFREANLIRANLRKAYLSEADLQKAYLTEAQLQDAILVGANLTGAVLMQARLEGAFLKGARLEQAQMFGAVLEGVIDGRRIGADFDKAFLNELDLRNPLTGQVDTQIRDWLIRYFPREARCLAIGGAPAIAEIEKTRELPAPEISPAPEEIHDTLRLPAAPRTPVEKSLFLEKTIFVDEQDTVELHEPITLPEGFRRGDTIPVR